MGTVSVVIPTYNCAETLERALQSVFGQTYACEEVIVVNDCSTDSTEDLLRGFAGRIKTINTGARSGAAAARNMGIDAAKGKYVAFLDADDLWLPEKIERQMEVFETSPHRPALVTCNSSRIAADGKTPLQEDHHATHPPGRGDRVWRRLLERNFIPTPTVMMKRDALVALGGFDETLPIAEDYDLWIRASFAYGVDFSQSVLVRFHERPGSLMKEMMHRNAELTLKVINRYLDEYERHLESGAKRSISGGWFLRYGYEAYLGGDYSSSIGYCLDALRSRHRVFKVGTVLLRAAVRGGWERCSAGVGRGERGPVGRG